MRAFVFNGVRWGTVRTYGRLPPSPKESNSSAVRQKRKTVAGVSGSHETAKWQRNSNDIKWQRNGNDINDDNDDDAVDDDEGDDDQNHVH